MIRFACPNCGQKFEAPSDMAGEKVDCTSCRALLTVPGASPAIVTPHEEPLRVSCPFCGEEISSKAKICKHCSRDLSEDLPEQILFQAQPARLYYTMSFLLVLFNFVVPLLIIGVTLIFFFRMLGAFPVPTHLPRHTVSNFLPLLSCPAVGIFCFLGIYWWLLQLSRKNTHFTVTSKRLIAKWGVLSKHTSEIPIKTIQAVKLEKPFIPRLFGLGNLRFSSASARADDVVFFGISTPEVVKIQIEKILFKK